MWFLKLVGALLLNLMNVVGSLVVLWPLTVVVGVLTVGTGLPVLFIIFYLIHLPPTVIEAFE